MRNAFAARLTLAAIACLLTAGAQGQRRTPGDEALAQAAARRVNAVTLEALPGVMITGDSHAGGLANGPICGHKVVDAATGGLTAPLALDAWSLAPPAAIQSDAIVLEIGTNDQQTKRRPERNRPTFERAVSQLVDRLQARTGTLVVLAIPPNRHPLVTADGVAQRNAWLADLCHARGCRYLDPFTASREGDGQTMRDGFTDDGVHYKDYAPYRGEIERLLCPVKYPHSK
jgi:lysophospholipase L1-like esterase